MSPVTPESGKAYLPDRKIEPGPLYAWPPQPLNLLRFLLIDMWFPWFFGFVGLAFVSWYFLTPEPATMSEIKPGWVALIWLRNTALWILTAGALHWWLYMRRAQGTEYKLHKNWLATDSKKFLWKNQVRDNMFWGLVWGVPIWTAFEAATLWFYANGKQPILTANEQPIYLVIMLWAALFWNTIHFYIIHRFAHFKPVYKHVHELHHRNINIGPWSGLAMHPVEHVLYFSSLMLWWVVPVHPVVIMVTSLILGLAPAITHTGFDQLKLWGNRRIPLGDWFHQLHHQYFEVNYGNTLTPLDKVFGSWHDGSPEGLAAHRARTRGQ